MKESGSFLSRISTFIKESKNNDEVIARILLFFDDFYVSLAP